MEALDRAMPFGGDGATAPSVGEQWEMPLADDQLGVRLGKHQGTAERRVNGCDQQPVVTPGQCQRDGTGRIGAASIADPPLAALGRLEVTAGLSAEADWRNPFEGIA